MVEILKQAQQVSIVSETYFYLLTSLDSHTVDLEPFTVSNENKTFTVVISNKRKINEPKKSKSEIWIVWFE
jgi:hypothetical protein